MKQQLPLFSVLALAAATASAQTVQFDLSSSFNYDGVGTQNEVTANVPANGNFLVNSLGDHSINGNNRSLSNQGSVTSGTALPDDGVIGGGKYQISTVFDNGTDYLTKVNNTTQLAAAGSGTVVTYTYNLTPEEQGQYTSFNFLSNSQRDASATGYRSWVEAVYSDGTVILIDTGLSDSGDLVRGTIGNNNVTKDSDTYTFLNTAPGATNTVGVSNAYVMDRGLSQSGSTQSVRSGTFGIYEVDYDALTVGVTDIPLDPGRTLEALNFNIRSAGVNRDQELYVWAISATPVPEPATYALLFAAVALGVAIRRRSRRA